MNFKEEYDSLLKSGMFFVIFPEMTGIWGKDMSSFIEFKVVHHNGLLK